MINATCLRILFNIALFLSPLSSLHLFKTSTCTRTYKLLIPKGICNFSFYANTNTTKFFMNKTEYKLLYELFTFSNSIEIGTFLQTYFYSINIDTYHKLNLIL